MALFELVILLLFVASLLVMLAQRIGAPYPALLAIAGAALAFVPGAPVIDLDPQLALALFVAPVLLDAAFDASLRDLRDNWRPVSGLAIGAVGATTAAVALVSRLLVPEMSWPAALALGAIVAPPDAAAAKAVLSRLSAPYRVTVVLEGESLLNDASALLIWRLAVAAGTAGGLSLLQAAPVFLLTSVGSIAAAVILAWLYVRLTRTVEDLSINVLLQFLGTFAVWLLADRLGLSAIITTVAYAISVARLGSGRVRPKLRIVSFAVWTVAVLVLNMLAFVLVGLQLKGILQRMDGALATYAGFAAAVCGTVIVVRLAWVMGWNLFVQWKNRRYGAHVRRDMQLPTTRTGLLVSWCGMRGIVTLATALALPAATQGSDGFPFRDLLVFTAFCVVLTTLVLQGLTLPGLLRVLHLGDDGERARELRGARVATARAALAVLDGDEPEAAVLRRDYETRLRRADDSAESPPEDSPNLLQLVRKVVSAERAALIGLWSKEEIGDAVFREMEAELDWSDVTSAARLGEPWEGEDRG